MHLCAYRPLEFARPSTLHRTPTLPLSALDTPSMDWQSVCSATQAHRASLIPSEWILDVSDLPKNVTGEVASHLDSHELEITNSDISTIIEHIRNKRWTSHEVVRVFCHRAAVAHQLVNCLTEILFEQALARAHEADAKIERGEVLGPLHGLPFTLKDEFDLKGAKTTLCLVSKAADPPMETTSPNIQILLNAGAIPIAKTMTPTGVFNIETVSSLFGKTVNPYNSNFASGGSTGGEAALLALRGSPLGVGSDLGGSIRQPASQTGIYGLRMSTGRTPHWIADSMVLGGESLKGTNGPMSSDLEALKLYAKLMATEGWKYDINVVNKPWREFQQSSFRFGVVLSAGPVVLTPPVKRALAHLVSKLKAKGTSCHVIAPDITEKVAQFSKFMSSSGNKRFISEIEATGEHVAGLASLKNARDIHTSELWKWQRDRSAAVKEFWELWNDLSLDGMIMPVSAHAGFKFGDFEDVVYSPLANVVDLPACAFPVGYASVSDVGSAPGMPRYDPLESDGVPVGLQVLGPRLEEEKVLAMVEYLVSVYHE